MIVTEIEKVKEFKFEPFKIEIEFESLDEVEEITKALTKSKSNLTGNLYRLLCSKAPF